MRYHEYIKQRYKDMSKYKVGDRVIVTGSDGGHKFNVGEVVLLTSFDSAGFWKAYNTDRSDYWYITEEEFEPYRVAKAEIPKEVTYDTVSKPAHYNHGDGIECIDYIKQVLGKEGFVAYCRGNQMKYQHRAMYKGNPVEDLEKARQYLDWAIETLKGGE